MSAWTTEKPTVAGYYWLRTMLMNNDGFERGSLMIRVHGDSAVVEHGGQFTSYRLDSMTGEFQGPITPKD